MLDSKEQKTLTMKLKFIRNRAIFKVTNRTHEAVTLYQRKYRFEITRLLQDKARSPTAKPQLHVSL